MGAAGRDQSVVRQRDGGPLGARVSVGQAASDSSPVTDRYMPDLRGGLADGDRKLPWSGELRRAVPDKRPDADNAAARIDGLKRTDAVDVDQDRGPRQPESQQREQALAACQHLGFICPLTEQV